MKKFIVTCDRCKKEITDAFLTKSVEQLPDITMYLTGTGGNLLPLMNMIYVTNACSNIQNTLKYMALENNGVVYIISNPTFKGYLKIGITENIKERLQVYQTSSPHRNFKVEYYIAHPKYKIAEKKIKEMMKYFATDTIQKGEWFQIPLHMAISRLDEQLDDYNANPTQY